MNPPKTANLSEEMQLFLDETGQFRAFSRQLFEIQPAKPVDFLYESAIFRPKAAKLLEIYEKLHALLGKSPDFLAVHRVLCEFFVFQGNFHELSLKNLEKLYKLLLFELPEKLVSLIIEVKSRFSTSFSRFL